MFRPLILIHGYSDQGASFEAWKNLLVQEGFPVGLIHIITYRTLTNEVSLKDIAEGFNRALRRQAGLGKDEDFDVIVHSTGMLVVRSWLATYPARRSRLKHIIGLAPATFGSPLAHAGRSTLGALFKGNKTTGPDFLEAGKEVLDGLELASTFTWQLAHQDLLADQPVYGPDGNTPYVFVFCGNQGYGGLRRLINSPGTDGTVRWAGCALDTRKIQVDLTRTGSVGVPITVRPWTNLDFPLYLVPGCNHGTLLSVPQPKLVELVYKALEVDSKAAFDGWSAKAEQAYGAVRNQTPPFQQFIIRATDERGDGIADYNVQLLTRDDENDEWEEMPDFDLDVHVYERDNSLRAFHVDLARLNQARRGKLALQIIANSDSTLVGYLGYNALSTVPDEQLPSLQTILLDLTPVVQTDTFSLFHPFTTTLVELKLNREPLPWGDEKANQVCWFH